MWKKSAAVIIRMALTASIAVWGSIPVSAAGLPPIERGSAPMLPHLDRLGLAEIILAQTVDHPDKPDGGQRSSRRDGEGARPGFEEILNPMTTRRIVRDIESIRGECGRYDEIYRIDCLRQGLEMTAAQMPDGKEYREAKRILRKAGNRLSRVVAAYQDTSAPKLSVPANANPRFKKRRHYVAVRRDALPKAMAEARKVVDEATTELLRSGENSERRYAHYQEISVAVDSTKVLLRSS